MTEKPTYEELEQRIKDLENAFKEFEKRYQQLYSNAPVMVHSIDQEGILLDVSEFWLEKMGYERKDVIGKKSIDFLTEGSRQKAIDIYLPEFFKCGHIRDVPYQMVKKNGNIIEVLLSAISQKNENNDIIRTFAVCVDISDQMRTERKLRESEKDLKLAQKIGKIGNWSWVIGPDRAEWSDQVYEIFKAPRKEPSYEFAKTFVHPEDLELWEGTVQRAVENKKPFAIDYRAIRSDGQIIWVHNETETVFNDDGYLIGYRGTIQDITNRKIEEEKLGEKEGKYRLLFENAQDAIFIADPVTGTLLDVNKSAEKLTGYNRNELVGKHQTFIHPPEQSDYYSREFIKSVRDKYSTFKEMVVRTRKGNDVPVEISSGGTVLGKNRGFHVGFFRDISDRKRIVESLKKSESLFRGLYDYMTSVSAIYEVINDGSKGSDYIVKNFNKKSLKIEGKTLEQVVGKSLFDLRPNIDQYGLIPVMKKVWETGESAYFPIKIYQDAIFSNYYENYIFRIPTGEVVTIYNDVTDQKNAESALKKSEERFKLAMEFTNDGLFDWNLETNEIYYSPVWKRLLGYDDDQLPNDFSVWETLTHPEDVKRSWKMQNELVNRQRDKFEIEFRMKHKDGHWVDIFSRANAIFDENHKAVRIIGTHVDISERKFLENRLLQYQKLESIGNLAGGIAHDFNNILFPIIGMSEILVEDLPTGSLERENAEEILKAGKRGSDLVKQILAFSRQSEQKKMPMRVQKILKEVMKMCRSTIPSNIKIIQDIQGDCSLVDADATQVHQITMNLITNAYHAVEPKGGEIAVRLREVEVGSGKLHESDLLPGRYALLSISDTGIGIEPAIMDKIFEPYFTTKEQGKGTGLGLSVVYGIVKEHHGDIKIHSELGKGTTFNVYLPIMENVEKSLPVEGQEDSPAGRERILLVDDEQPVVKLEEIILERLGYEVTMCLSSLEALEIFRTDPNSFDLVISDMTMPHMTGDQLAKDLIAIRAEIPIIICTGFSERLNQEKAASIGVKGFLMKPIIKFEFAKMVRKVLDDTKSKSQG